ncbi:MAG: hypothetical protein J7647_00080 [Cyanobacteria bacterium SBLK]|nr:hypothetical protein [Cyanobacteria bacterium SBLK]
MIVNTYALNRSCNGDAVLFRPILYFLLGLEQWIFGYQFEYWQLTGILLHLLVLFVFFALLKFQPESRKKERVDLWSHLLVFGVTLLFGVQYISMEMVVWHHINGYLIFTCFLLAGILFLKYYISNQNYIFLSLSFLLILLSAFTYELGSIAGLLIAIYLFSLRWDKSIKLNWLNGLPFLAIPLVYTGLSLFDLHYRQYTAIPFPNFMEGSLVDTEIGLNLNNTQTTFINFLFKPLIYTIIYVTIWASGGVIPSLYELKAGGRMRLAPQLPTFSLISIGLIIITVFLIIILLKTRLFNIQKFKKELAYFLLLVGLLISYTEIIIYGRTLAKGWQNILANNLYYAYFFNILLFLSLYHFLTWCTSPHFLHKSRQTLFQLFLVFLMTFNILTNSAYVYAMNIKMIDFSRPILVLLERSLKTIQAHSHEPDFSFKVEDRCEENTVLKWLNSYTLVEAVFPKFYSEENYKYIVPCKE